MKEQWPLFAAVVVAVLFIVGANYALPQPAPPPVKMSTASVPTSVKPTPKPTPRPVPSYKESLENASEFKPIAPYTRQLLDDYKPLELMVAVQDKQILFEGKIACDFGRMEYLIVELGGKAHESLVLGYVNPQALNVAAVALGAKLPEEYDSRVYDVGPEGEIDDVWPLFRIELLYRDEAGKVFRSRPEDFILNQIKDTVMPHLPWAYTGSYFYYDKDLEQEYWASSVSKNIAAIFRDNSCVFMTTDPNINNDEVYVAHTEAMPPAGTRILVLMTLLESSEER